MEDNSHCCTSGNSETMCCSCASSGDDDRVEELSASLSGQLKINDVRTVPIERDCIVEDEEDEDEDDDYFSEEALLAQMGYAKSDHGGDYDEEEGDLSEESILAQKKEPPKPEPINTPIDELNLVSAFKGSREKEGRAVEKCRVSWAPDVYDPPCTSDDHFTLSSTERHKSEHKVKGAPGKNRQKSGGKGTGVIEGRVGGGGKGSRAGGSKGSEGGAKAAGGSMDKKKAEKKHKKHGGGAATKYSNPAE